MQHNLGIRILRLGLLLGLGTAVQAFATTYLVNKLNDDNGPCTPDDCAVREAIIAANENPGKDTILVPPGDYLLTIPGPADEDVSLTGDLDIFDHLDLRGDEHQPTILRSNGTDRVLSVYGRSTVTLSHLTFTGGRHLEEGAGVKIFDSHVTISHSTICNNEVTGAFGGGIAVILSEVELRNCVVTGNFANESGGGIWRVGQRGYASDLTLINTTVSGNTSYFGGGIYTSFEGALYLINSTIAANTATGRGDAVGVFYGHGPTAINTLIEGDCSFAFASLFTSNGHNLESPSHTCGLSHPTDHVSVSDLRLGPLADNGGPTLTHALWADSPAIDSADPAACPPEDQRGTARPVDGNGDGSDGCDVGAFELLPEPAAVEVPTLGRPGLVALAILLGGIALGVVRRSRALAGGAAGSGSQRLLIGAPPALATKPHSGRPR
jgi:hypothetical protein